MMRECQESDDAAILALYDGKRPKLFYERVLVEDGKIVGHGGIRMVPEAVLALAKGHPAAKMHWLKMLQEEFKCWLNGTDHKRIFALVAPKIARAYIRRLAGMGWREGYQSAIYLAEGEDEQREWH
jgi:hypothetical protein